MNYKYQSDLDKYNTLLDIWEVPSMDSSGVYRGDCESYCLLLKKLNPEYKDFKLWYCKLYWEGHCVLIHGTDIIDCNTQAVVSLEMYCKMFNVTDLRPYSWFQIFSKKLFTKGYLLWRTLRGLKEY